MSLPIPLRTLVAVALVTGATALHAQIPDDENKPDASQAPDAAVGDSTLTPDLFYRLLLGDVALQRGDVTLAARAYIDAARVAADPRLARRATEIAIASRQRRVTASGVGCLGRVGFVLVVLHLGVQRHRASQKRDGHQCS